jgi:Flp pilus assembly protein TadD
MIAPKRKRARFGLASLGAGMLLASAPAAAQPAAAQESAGDTLSRDLRSLSQNPRSLQALMGAGMSALQLGDAQAALTFFARAEEIDPRDGRIKMWIGSALVQLEQPRGALKFFGEAVSLGVPEMEVARDRGLVHDMMGDPRRAQADYRLALRRGPDPEATRRLALSLAISGEREKALQLLEEQLLVRDHAAARTRAFVLALTGDSAGANRAAREMMPGPQAAAMAPFLDRLPSLAPSDRALAVHFGHFPGEGRTRPADTYAALDHTTQAGRPDAGQAALGRPRSPAAEPVSDAPRRRPGTQGAEQKPKPIVTAAAASSRPVAAPVESRQPIPPPRVEVPPVEIALPGPAPAPAPAETDAPAGTEPQLAITVPEADTDATRAKPEMTTVAPPQPEPASPSAGSEASRLAEVAALVAALPDAEPEPPAASPPPRAKAQPPRPAASAKSKKPVPPKPADPARHWVQVAGGANTAWLPREYARLKAKAPKLLGARSAWTIAVNATNRLLVGPFASTKEAQAFVNELAKQSLSGFVWSSAAGQKIDKLPAK